MLNISFCKSVVTLLQQFFWKMKCWKKSYHAFFAKQKFSAEILISLVATEDGQMAERGVGTHTPLLLQCTVRGWDGTKQPNWGCAASCVWKSAAKHGRFSPDCRNEQPMRNFLEDSHLFFKKANILERKCH